MSKFRRRRGANNAGQITHGSDFMERQMLEYAIRVINSNYLCQYTDAVFNFVCSLEKDSAETLFRKALKVKGIWRLKKYEDPDTWETDEFSSLKSHVGKAKIIKVIKNEIQPLLKEKYKNCKKNTVTDRRLGSLKKIFRLNEVDCAILSYLYCTSYSRQLEHLVDHLELGKKVIFFINLGKILGFHRNEIQKALKGNLTKCKLIDMDERDSAPEWIEDYLSNLNKTLNEEFFIRFKGTALDLDAHLIDKPEAEVLRDLVSQNKPANFLFYGEPGTGKTEMAKSLASCFKKDLLVINNRKNVKSDELKTALIATTNIVDPKTSLILVDEADDLLNSSRPFFFTGEKGQKSWIHDFMDQNKHKIIWVTNRSEYIEASTMRRFAFSLKFKPFNLRKKMQVFNYCLKKYGYQDLFSEDELIKICRRYTINAGGISDALKNLKVGKKPDKTRLLGKVETILKNHQTAITGIEYKGNRLKEMGEYSLKALNPSENLDLVISTLRGFPGSGDKGGRPANINVLLYGAPGAGKTEFVKYLGNSLQKEILVKRASDLLNCYWGETEKMIANAFEEAENNESILFLDEADSFLRSRESTQHSWENSQINELLTQMENFRGILICSTNFLKGLDQAALRRFKFKIEFKSLTAEGVMEMYQTVLVPLILDKDLTDSETRELSRLSGLTPGDFHVVAEKYYFADQASISHKLLIDSLKEELKLKPKTSAIGFAA